MGMDAVYIRRKLGQEPVRYAHPELVEVLEPTYGVIVYQEQVMRIAQILAGFSLAEADVLRKAVGKKDAELIAQELGKFVTKAVALGVDQKIVQDLADQIEAFGRYGFNKSHSAAYGLLSYQTAWLKCHYPAEFMAALMSSVVDKAEDVVAYIADCRELGKYLPEKVTARGWTCFRRTSTSRTGSSPSSVTGSDRFASVWGRSAGIGEGAVRSILAAREAEGPFRSMFDLLEPDRSAPLQQAGDRGAHLRGRTGWVRSLVAGGPSSSPGSTRPSRPPSMRRRSGRACRRTSSESCWAAPRR